MAGTNSNFSAAAFRDAVHFAMRMGTPTDFPVTFRWTETKTFATHDPAGKPYSWTQTPATDVTHPDVEILVAVEEGAVSEEETGMGLFNPAKAVLTVLDEDYALVEGADQVLLSGKVYEVRFAMAQGLFEVTVWKVGIEAADIT